MDTCFWFFTPLVTKWLTRLSLIVPLGIFIWFGGTTVEAFKSGAYHGYGPLSRQPIWLQILPADRLPQNFGIPEAFPTNFVGQLLKPFANWAGK